MKIKFSLIDRDPYDFSTTYENPTIELDFFMNDDCEFESRFLLKQNTEKLYPEKLNNRYLKWRNI